MASKHPVIVQAIADHSCLVGRSNNMIRVTNKLMMIDVEPKTPTVAGGSHVNAKKSKVDAAAERKIATMNKGRQKTGHFKGTFLFRFLVLGS